MAVTKLWPIRNDTIRSAGSIVKSVTDYAENENKTSDVLEGLTMENVISYVERDTKTKEASDSGQYVTTINCSKMYSVEEMIVTKKLHRERGSRILWHGYQSFKPGEVTAAKAHRIGVETAEKLWGDRFEVVVTTHLDREHLHNHIVINSVSFIDGKKFDWDREYPKLRKVTDELCRNENLSVVETDELSGHYHRGQERASSRGKMTLQSVMKEDIDSCIAVASSFDGFEYLMNTKGYRIDCSGKYLKVYKEGHERPVRIDRRWGEGYTVEGITQRIALENEVPDDYIAGSKDAFISGIDSEAVRKEVGKEAEKEARRETEILDVIGSVNYVLRIITKDVLYLTDIRKTSLSYDIAYHFLSPYGIRIPGYYHGGVIRGLAAGFVKYNIMIGVYKRTPAQVARTHYILRDDLIKLDRYIAETKLLMENDITTEDELTSFIESESAKLQKLDTKRIKLRNRIRRASDEEKDSLKEQLKEMNKEIKQQKKTVYYGNDIHERFKEMKDRIERVHRCLWLFRALHLWYISDVIFIHLQKEETDD